MRHKRASQCHWPAAGTESWHTYKHKYTERYSCTSPENTPLSIVDGSDGEVQQEQQIAQEREQKWMQPVLDGLHDERSSYPYDRHGNDEKYPCHTSFRRFQHRAASTAACKMKRLFRSAAAGGSDVTYSLY